MKAINRKRAEIVINHPMVAGENDCSSTISFIISTLLSDCPTYTESVSCTDDCPTTEDFFPLLILSDVFNADFSNMVDAIWANFPSKMCAKCSQPALMKINFAPILFIEVFENCNSEIFLI